MKDHIVSTQNSARDRSFVHTSDRSEIEARNQSCVAARKNALVNGFDDSLVFTCGNARSIASGNSFSLDEKCISAGNLRENILTVMKHPHFKEDPILAVQILIQAILQEKRSAINNKLLSMGCDDATKTKNILNRWVKTQGEDIAYER